MIDTSTWKEFKVGGLFDSLLRGKCHSASELEDGEDVWYVGAKKSNNGLMRCVKHEPELEFAGNCIVFICNGEGSVGYALYQDKTFIPSGDLIVGYCKRLNPKVGLFLVSILDMERPKYSFGRKWGKYVKDTVIKLPADNDGNPDWDYMERFIDKLSAEPVTTSNKSNDALSCELSNTWREYTLNTLYEVRMGNKFDMNKMGAFDPKVNFVTRISSDNGVAGKVDYVEGVIPNDAGLVTVALGGSLGSAFVQHEPFYTAQNVAILKPRFESMSLYVNLFVASLIRFESQTKYCAFGRELNAHINRDFTICLPADDIGNPDWQWIEDYMRSLPYSDRIGVEFRG